MGGKLREKLFLSIGMAVAAEGESGWLEAVEEETWKFSLSVVYFLFSLFPSLFPSFPTTEKKGPPPPPPFPEKEVKKRNFRSLQQQQQRRGEDFFVHRLSPFHSSVGKGRRQVGRGRRKKSGNEVFGRRRSKFFPPPPPPFPRF